MSQEKETALSIENGSNLNKPYNPTNNDQENSEKNMNNFFSKNGISKKLELLKTETNLSYGLCSMPLNELGVLMSLLYRIQNILVLNSSQFDDVTLRLLQVYTYVSICMYSFNFFRFFFDIFHFILYCFISFYFRYLIFLKI
jgi:hypothetical protein